MGKEIGIIIAIVVFLMIIGALSTVHKSASQPLRKKSLNDLKETLPRNSKDKTSDSDEKKASN
ncbi:hypothetical protein [Thalassotalea agarivorans]|uniref:Uncharacterized protein n=1 Tax=Thalassotalea agarivorans TaxID=349064 RepID=A0A1I0DJF9_THASX|nr:hypothetical protein [Thalassotalea agarivorans]SET32478.1 hypothetical protein SAMN05660429_01542 [Thalassotalea agarivorans]